MCMQNFISVSLQNIRYLQEGNISNFIYVRMNVKMYNLKRNIIEVIL